MRAVDRLEVRCNPLPNLPRHLASSYLVSSRLVSLARVQRESPDEPRPSRQLKHPGNSTDDTRVVSISRTTHLDGVVRFVPPSWHISARRITGEERNHGQRYGDRRCRCFVQTRFTAWQQDFTEVQAFLRIRCV